MKSIAIPTILIMLVSACACKAQDTSGVYIDSVIATVLENSNNLAVFYKKGAIPRSIKMELSSLQEKRFKIANPGRKFRKGDVVRNPFLKRINNSFL